MFIERKEFYQYGSSAKRLATNYLIYDNVREQVLINNHLPESTGASYLYVRQHMQVLGDEMGLDFMALHPELTYQQCIEATKGLD